MNGLHYVIIFFKLAVLKDTTELCNMVTTVQVIPRPQHTFSLNLALLQSDTPFGDLAQMTAAADQMLWPTKNIQHSFSHCNI